MSESRIPSIPVLPATGAETSVVTELSKQVNEESQVIVHCSFRAGGEGEAIRIWKSTFLNAKDSNHKSKLIHLQNITLYPDWTPVMKGNTLSFTLYFAALPKDCMLFDLVEEIPQAGGFEVRNIKRNNMDVYSLILG